MQLPARITVAIATVTFALALSTASAAAWETSVWNFVSDSQVSGDPANITAAFLGGANANLNGDDVKSVTFEIPTGMIVNFGVAGSCSLQQLAGDACPSNSTVGSFALAVTIGGTDLTTIQGTAYVIKPPSAGSVGTMLFMMRPVGFLKFAVVGQLLPVSEGRMRIKIDNLPRTLTLQGPFPAVGNITINTLRVDLRRTFVMNPIGCGIRLTRMTTLTYAGVAKVMNSTYPIACF